MSERESDIENNPDEVEFGAVPAASPEQMNDVVVGWIYRLRKHQLQNELLTRGLDIFGTVAQLRERLSLFLRTGRRLREVDREINIGEEEQEPSVSMRSPIEDVREAVRRIPGRINPVIYGENQNISGVIDRVRKWGLRFDGTQGKAISFLERLQELKEGYDVPDEGLFRSLPELLTNGALLWYRCSRDNWKTWVEWNGFVSI